MRLLIGLCVGTVVLAGPGSAQSTISLSGAEWKVVKSEEAPPGTRVLFAPDGKLTVTYMVDGAPRALSGTYTLSGTQLTLKLAHDGRERVEVRTVRKLTETVLVTEDRNRKLEELHR